MFLKPDNCLLGSKIYNLTAFGVVRKRSVELIILKKEFLPDPLIPVIKVYLALRRLSFITFPLISRPKPIANLFLSVYIVSDANIDFKHAGISWSLAISIPIKFFPLSFSSHILIKSFITPSFS